MARLVFVQLLSGTAAHRAPGSDRSDNYCLGSIASRYSKLGVDEMAGIKIQDLNYCYPETIKPALNRINLEVSEGQLLIITGNSGSGKSTLLRAISGLIPAFYNGNLTGKIYLNGIDTAQIDRRQMVQEVGMVFQNPESQLVMMNVEQEIAFGLENLGLPAQIIKRRIMEISSSLGISSYLGHNVSELSGGQKQKVALAAVLAMHPGILLLDEPTSQLDPVAAEELLNVIRRLNEDHGTTVIMIEQRLERCCHLADRILVMENGVISADIKTGNRAGVMWPPRVSVTYLPPLPGLFARAGFQELPLTVKQGRQMIKAILAAGIKPDLSLGDFGDLSGKPGEALLEITDLWYSYPNSTDEVLKNLSLTVKEGDFIAIMGENGAGKTTLLKNLNGLLRPRRGKVFLDGQDTREMAVEELAPSIAYLSQDPNDFLFMPTVREEIAFTLKNLNLQEDGYSETMLYKFKLDTYTNCNPRDLSTGERQRVALASVLVSKPRLLLLDEPTRGLDYQLKEELGRLLEEINRQGTTVVMVTHDVDFAAEYARDICLMFDGEVIELGDKYKVLQHATFYSPQVARLFHKIADNVINVADGVVVLQELTHSIRQDAVSFW